MAERFFSEELIQTREVVLGGSEAHHLSHVMRAKRGDRVVVFDGSGAEFSALVDRVERRGVTLAIVERHDVDRELPVRVTMGVALPKGERQRWLVEKLVELGVGCLVPLWTSRGVARATDSTRDRLQRGVIEACKQCGRNRLMEISEPMEFDEFLTAAPADAQRILAHPGGESPWRRPASCGYYFAVGPEGGFSDAEVDRARQFGWQCQGLGRRILRVETAALALAARAAADCEVG